MKKVIALLITYKVWTFVLIFLAFNLLPFNKTFYQANFIYPTGQKISLQTAYKTWDAQHYLFLADKGYIHGNSSNAFYPLFPLLIRLATFVIHNSLIAGLLVSNFCSFFGFIYIYKFVKAQWNEKIAFLSLCLFLFFPTAFYTSLIYSESIFILLAGGFFYYLFQKKFLPASIFAFLLPLTRPVGIFIVLPLMAFLLIKDVNSVGKLQDLHIVLRKRLLLTIVPILGFCTYLLMMYLWVRNPFTGFSATSTYIAHWSVSAILTPTQIFSSFFVPNLSLHGFTTSLIDRLFFLLFLCMLPVVYKKTNLVLFLFTASLGLVPFFGTFMSYTRYLLLAFPLFITLAVVFNKEKFSYLIYPYLFISLTFETLFLIMHVLNFWVS